MRRTRPWLRAGSVFVAAAFVACGKAESDGDEASSGGDGGRGASASSGGRATMGGGPSGASGGQSQTSGGRSATGGRTNTGGSVTDGGRAAGGAGGTTTGGVSGAGAAGGDSGGEDSAGAAGLGGQGGAGECPAIKCATQCDEYWVELDGCQGCACAPPAPKLVVQNVSCPPAALTISETSGYYVGGYNRWLLDFDWACSDMSLLGEPSRAHLQVGLLEPMSPPIAEKNRTFFYPPDAGSNIEYEIRSATVWVRGSGLPEIEIPLVAASSTSFLSVRIENGRLVGGVEFVGSSSAGTYSATLAGPFSGAVPSSN